ncbi:MAG TPA: hypothetical protein VN702_03515 [Acetobacteraceae bacterium]|nr:hypothetical protein [Acetobacteraceae bacterium]
MSDRTAPRNEAIEVVIPTLLRALAALETASRFMHPPRLPQLADDLDEHDTALRDALARLHATGNADETGILLPAVEYALQACEGVRAAPAQPNPMVSAYRAMRQLSRSLEALYPLATDLDSVSNFFLEPSAHRAAPHPPFAAGTGVAHVRNQTNQRGGFSIYVPEDCDHATPMPLIMALHGGAGHGRLFLWNWVREARSRRMIVVAPTAIGSTWSLMEPEVDTDNLARILDNVSNRWSVDASHRLLTGMSDGGTFTLLSGLSENSPFTHLAPVAASFHPLLVAVTEPTRIAGLPIYLIHGALDWMFPVSVGRTAHRTLAAAGAQVTYCEVADLSHAYPRDRNGDILDWLQGSVPKPQV